MTNREIPPIEVGQPQKDFSWLDAVIETQDSLATQEEKYFDDEKALKDQKRKNDLQWLKLYGLVVLSFMVFFSFLFAAMIFVLIIHYLTPWEWLSAEKLNKIQTIVFSGSVGTVVSTVVSKQISKS